MELIVATYFYKSFYGLSKNYDQCTKSAAQGFALFPTNSRIAYYQGYAYYMNHEYGEANKALSRYLRLAPVELQAEVRELLQNSQERFLNDWYAQADFYQSPGSRIEVSQFFQKVTLFQFTPYEEQNFGDLAFRQVVGDSPQVHDQELQAYLEQLVSDLTSRTPGPPFQYDVLIIKASEANAFASPGHLLVTTGLLSFVDSESQLVGALAHELAHTYGHHTARKLIADYRAKYAVNMMLNALNLQSQSAQITSVLAANIGLDLLSRAFSRYEEKEADLYATHIMFNSGFNPTGLSSFFLEKYKQNPKQGMKFLRTHPPDQDRASYLTNYIESFPLDREMRVDSEAFKKIKARFSVSE
jgi:predicted Zn-dependent protease